MLLQDALVLTCGALCLQVHQVLQTCTKQLTIKTETRREGGHYTWLVKDTHWFTLIKQGKLTLVYAHANNTLYYATPNVQLAESCPDGHSFLCQVCSDRGADGLETPRLLVTDLVTPEIPDPLARGTVLRSLAHVFPPVCHVQWAGERECLVQFMPKIPHETDGIVLLGGDALSLVLEAQARISPGLSQNEVCIHIPSQPMLTDPGRVRASTASFLSGEWNT